MTGPRWWRRTDPPGLPPPSWALCRLPSPIMPPLCCRHLGKAAQRGRFCDGRAAAGRLPRRLQMAVLGRNRRPGRRGRPPPRHQQRGRCVGPDVSASQKLFQSAMLVQSPRSPRTPQPGGGIGHARSSRLLQRQKPAARVFEVQQGGYVMAAEHCRFRAVLAAGWAPADPDEWCAATPHQAQGIRTTVRVHLTNAAY